jgi:hypothetical protein
LLRFDRARRGHVLLSPQSTEALGAGKVNVPGEEGARYASGFEAETVNGERIVGHGGGFPGINSKLDLYLDGGYSVVVLSNDDMGARPVVERLRELITRK